MLMSASDLALMKGEAAVQPGDGPELALVRAAEYGYALPDARRIAFTQGFVQACACQAAPELNAGVICR